MHRLDVRGVINYHVFIKINKNSCVFFHIVVNDFCLSSAQTKLKSKVVILGFGSLLHGFTFDTSFCYLIREE